MKVMNTRQSEGPFVNKRLNGSVLVQCRVNISLTILKWPEGILEEGLITDADTKR